MAFFTLEDRYHEMECIAFPNKYAAYASFIMIDNAILIEGSLQFREGEPPKLLVNTIQPLTENDKYVPESPKASPIKPMHTASTFSSTQSVPRQGITSVTQPPAKINKLYLRVPDMDCHIFRKVDNLVDIFDGWIPVIYYNNSTQQYVTSSKKVTLTPVCYAELISLLGKENVVPK